MDVDNNTDLIPYYPRYGDLFVDGPQMFEPSSHHHEKVFQNNSTGELEGEIVPLNNRGEIYLQPYKSEVKARLEGIVSCVGRIFAGYCADGADKTDLKFWMGSGFLVRKDIVLTAQHVVKESHQIEGITYKLHKVYIFFGVDATTGKEINLSQLASMRDAFELTLLPRVSDTLFPVPPCYGPVETRKTWNLNDFAFLRFVAHQPTSIPIALPTDPSSLGNNGPKECFVVGYPGGIDRKKFGADYGASKPTSDTDILYEAIRKQTLGFEHKIISRGKWSVDSEPLFPHRCPTLRGTSGGLFSLFEDGGIRFAGIHVGGCQELENNFMIPITSPAFTYAYFKLVADADFLKEYGTMLGPYKEYYDQLSINPT